MTSDITELHEKYQKELSGQAMLLLFNYLNICTDAEPTALLPIRVMVDGHERSLEEVAEIYRPDDFHFYVVPRDDKHLKFIIIGVMRAHPEFSCAIKCIDKKENITDHDPSQPLAEGCTKFIELSIPKVDKDRRDVLLNLVDTLYEQKKKQMEKVDLRFTPKNAALCQNKSPEDANEAQDSFKKIHDRNFRMIDKQKKDKIEKIEEAYRRYLRENAEQEAQRQEIEAAHNRNAGMSMNMFDGDE